MAIKTVLIADDDVALARAVAIRCREVGLEAQTLPDGLQAYAAIRQNPPDLLILDVNMPGVDGLYLCEQLVADAELAPIPVIILTGRSDRETVERCDHLGAHYVWKGLDTWDRLKPVICRFLEIAGHADSQAELSGGAGREDARRAPMILVVDDDPHFSKALKLRLEPHGVTVVRAFSGMQGFWSALKVQPSAIIMDYRMPNGCGDYLLDRLRRHSLTRDVPVIMVTGRRGASGFDHALEREVRRLGASALLPKPIDFHALLQELRRHVDIPVTRTPTALETTAKH